MKKIKGFVIFLIILLVYGLVLFFVFGKNENSDNNNTNNNYNTSKSKNIKENKYLVLGNISNFIYSDGVYTKANVKDIEGLDKLKTYVNNKYYGDYRFKMGNNWNLFDAKNEYVNYNGDLIAFSQNFNIKVRSNYKIRDINEKEKVYLINNFNINSFSNLTTNEVVDIDLDDNGEIDQIICLSSMEESNNIKNYYNIVLLTLNNERITLIEEREKDAKSVYSIYGIINVDNNQKDSIIITKTVGYISDEQSVSNLIYNYKNDKYVID